MRTRAQALLVHGLDSRPAWWDAFLPPLEEIGVRGAALAMPSLAEAGPEAWCEEVARRIGSEPTFLIGHSLGAAVCLMASLATPVAGLVLLACPPFVGGFSPPAPPVRSLSVTALARVARFLRHACDCAGRVKAEAIHLVGESDAHVPLAQARRLPFPLETVPAAGHQLNQSALAVSAVMRHLVFSEGGRRHLDPGLRLRYGPRADAFAAAVRGLGEEAPPPARLDVEITTRCQLACPSCARTWGYGPAADVSMPPDLFERVLAAGRLARDLIFVGLGEPLLHPEVVGFVERAAQRGFAATLVTNGLRADPELMGRLHAAGLAEITFSIDSLRGERFRRLRGGASLETVLGNFRAVPAGLRKSIFVTLSPENAGDLADIVALAHAERVPAVTVSDVNFAENQPHALHGGAGAPGLRQALECARRHGVLLLGPHFHDLANVRRDCRLAAVRKPADLAARSAGHRHCLAPWRIAVVGADGTVTPCNCAPRTPVGRMPAEPLDAIWNGEPMRRWRRAVRDGACGDCRICPRY